MEESIESITAQTPKKSKKISKFFKTIGSQIGKQLAAILGISFATAIGVVVAKIVWEWIKFVWSF